MRKVLGLIPALPPPKPTTTKKNGYQRLGWGGSRGQEKEGNLSKDI
jgi:hypothetical protein